MGWNLQVQYCWSVWQEKRIINKVQIRAWHKEKAVAQKENGNHKANRRSIKSRYEVLPICLEQCAGEEEKV